MNKHDLAFLKQFALVIAALFGVMLALIAGAWWIYAGVPTEVPPQKLAAIQARIAPVGDVHKGESGRAAILAAEAAAKAAAAAQVAYDGTLDGAVIYGKLCGACHTSGAGGAPQLTQAAWAQRVGQGMDSLVKHAIEGYQGPAGLMPARGGNPSLSDEQVRVTVQWMVDNLK